MPREVLNVLGVNPPREQQREAGMPQVVPAYAGQSRASEQRLEVAVDHVLGVERRPQTGGEDETVVLVRAARSELLLQLPLGVALESRQRLLRQIDGAPRGVSRARRRRAPAGDAKISVPPCPLDLPVHAQRRPLRVYVRPLQAQSPARAEPGGEREDVQSLQPVVGRGGGPEERARLL